MGADKTNSQKSKSWAFKHLLQWYNQEANLEKSDDLCFILHYGTVHWLQIRLIRGDKEVGIVSLLRDSWDKKPQKFNGHCERSGSGKVLETESER